MPVVDASIAVRWVVQQADGAAARRLIAQEGKIVAPVHILLEAHYAVAKLVRRDLATREQLAEVINIVGRFARTVPLEAALVFEAANISQAIRSQPFNIYDCVYIALARLSNDLLVTADQGQAAFAEQLGVSVQRL